MQRLVSTAPYECDTGDAGRLHSATVARIAYVSAHGRGMTVERGKPIYGEPDAVWQTTATHSHTHTFICGAWFRACALGGLAGITSTAYLQKYSAWSGIACGCDRTHCRRRVEFAAGTAHM